jgi:hypothetical protein
MGTCALGAGERIAGLDAAGRKRIRREVTGARGTREDAFILASNMLAGSPAQATPEVVEASYKLVQKEIEAGNAARFQIGE